MDRRQFLQGAGGSGALVGGLSWVMSSVTAWSSQQAIAHRARVTLTRVIDNPRSGRWEIIHAVHYHDAATALRRLDSAARLLPTEATGQARLMLEIERHILWSSQLGPLAPIAVGAELKGDSLWLYQECVPPPAGTSITIESRWLHSVFNDQVNRFSIEILDPPVLLSTSAAAPRVTFAT